MADRSTVDVEIFGQTYSVQAGSDVEHLKRVAAFVDDQMRRVSREAGAVDSVRVAVLAALNIADEHFRGRAAGDVQDERLEKLASELADALDK